MKDLKIHYSLLPAFQTDDPVRDAILTGVKVTGITITLEDKIVAQYPILLQMICITIISNFILKKSQINFCR